jgi:hypothetical protein
MIKLLQKPGFIILVCLFFILVVIIRNQREEIEKFKASEFMLEGGDIQKAQLIDSLQNELFISNTTIDRYDIALEYLREEDSIAAKKYEDKLSNIE